MCKGNLPKQKVADFLYPVLLIISFSLIFSILHPPYYGMNNNIVVFNSLFATSGQDPDLKPSGFSIFMVSDSRMLTSAKTFPEKTAGRT